MENRVTYMCIISWESYFGRILKICPHLLKLWPRIKWLFSNSVLDSVMPRCQRVIWVICNVWMLTCEHWDVHAVHNYYTSADVLLSTLHSRVCLDHLTKWSMIVTWSTADRSQRSVAPPRSSYLSRPLCWQCDTSVDGRSPSVGQSPSIAEDGRKGVFLLAISGSLHSL